MGFLTACSFNQISNNCGCSATSGGQCKVANTTRLQKNFFLIKRFRSQSGVCKCVSRRLGDLQLACWLAHIARRTANGC
jgi:hypothetical protein